MQRTIVIAGLLASVLAVSPALAVPAPKLPATAKKLTGKEIMALYDGHTVTFENFTMDKPITGTDTYNFKTKKHGGTYVFGTATGNFTGTIRVKGDMFCHIEAKRKETCSSVYTDGADIYETDASGGVQAINHRR